MSGTRFALPGLAVAATLLSISGCKSREGIHKDTTTATTILIGTDDGGKPEPHEPIAQGVTVRWRSPQNFSVTFQKDKDPCKATQTGQEDTYTAIPPSSSDPEYTVSCTISNNPRPGDKYRYGISLVQPSTAGAPAPSPAITPGKAEPLGGTFGGGVTGCGGCVLAVDSD